MTKTAAGKKNMSRRTKDKIFVAILMALPILQFFIFYVLVNFNSVFLAFKEYNSENGFTWIGFNNFKQLFADFKKYTIYKVALKNSLLVFLVGTSVSTILTLFFAYYIYKKTSRAKNIFKIILFMPSIIPAIAMATIFTKFADSAIPEFVKIVFYKNIQGFIQNPKFTMWTIIFYNVWIGFGVNLLLYLGAMNNISESVVEAAELDGVTFTSEFFYITLPIVFSTLQTLLVVAIGGIFINQANLVSFFGLYSEEAYNTIGYYLYTQTVLVAMNNTSAGLPKLAAFGILLTAITVPVVFAFNWLTKKYGPSVE